MMTEYITNPDQCYLNMSLFHLVYVLTMNILFIFVPAFALIIFYITMVVKLKNCNKLFKNSGLKFIKSEININETSLSTWSKVKERGQLKSLNQGNEISDEQQDICSYSIKIRLILKTSYKAFAFFCCHLPIKIFLFWSYINNYVNPVILNETDSTNNLRIRITDLISNTVTLIYFLHCVSNPIIYNFSSIKFRIATYKLLYLIYRKFIDCFCLEIY